MKHNWEYKRLGDICDFERGITYDKADESNLPTSVAILRSNNITLESSSLNFEDLKYLQESFEIQAKKKLTKGSILICMSNGSIEHLGKTAYVYDDFDYGFGGFMGLITPHIELSKYIFYFFHSKIFNIFLSNLNRGANIRNIQFSKLSQLNIPVPPMEVQEQIVAELDGINAQIDRCRQLLQTLDSLATSLFYDTFGDPATNPKGWTVKTLDEISKVLSDGPFGSNLKSDHYRKTGVRVIRLQNIGSGIFINKDKAFVDEGHYNNISKYTCYPGEVVIGTMGTPNLRACLVPEFIDKAIHKADCIRCVPKEDIANATFISALLNTPSILNEASKNIHGATRARISAGQLKLLRVILPPLALQQQFARQVEAIEAQKTKVGATIAQLQTLLDSRMDYWFGT